MKSQAACPSASGSTYPGWGNHDDYHNDDYHNHNHHHHHHDSHDDENVELNENGS